jgi:hypothetical protein
MCGLYTDTHTRTHPTARPWEKSKLPTWFKMWIPTLSAPATLRAARQDLPRPGNACCDAKCSRRHSRGTTGLQKIAECSGTGQSGPCDWPDSKPDCCADACGRGRGLASPYEDPQRGVLRRAQRGHPLRCLNVPTRAPPRWMRSVTRRDTSAAGRVLWC